MANSSKGVSSDLLSYSSSSSSNTPSPPPPPRPIVEVGHGGGSASGGSGESKKKRSRRNDGGASSSFGNGGGDIKRKRGELIDAPKTEPICTLCGKKFGSWKGVFGHLRAHPEREWRGAFPPPKYEPAPAPATRVAWSPIRIGHDHYPFLQRQLLAPTLLDSGCQKFDTTRQDILNSAPQQLGQSTTTILPPPEGGGGGGSGGFDLNLPPPPE